MSGAAARMTRAGSAQHRRCAYGRAVCAARSVVHAPPRPAPRTRRSAVCVHRMTPRVRSRQNSRAAPTRITQARRSALKGARTMQEQRGAAAASGAGGAGSPAGACIGTAGSTDAAAAPAPATTTSDAVRDTAVRAQVPTPPALAPPPPVCVCARARVLCECAGGDHTHA